MAFYDKAIVRVLPAVPRPLVKRLSDRYIAGETVAEAMAVVADLNAQGKTATIDVLGEEIHNDAEAEAIVRAYVEVLQEIERGGLEANVSVKLTGLGLKLSYDLCRANLETVVRDAAARGRFVRIDMEDSSTTDDTLRLYRGLREDGHDNVGVVLQAALRRTLDDIHGAGRPAPVGAHLQGHLHRARVDRVSRLRRGRGRTSSARSTPSSRSARASRSPRTTTTSSEEGRRAVERHGLAPEDYEFQMLLGVRPELANRLVAEGRRLRIYVPFGRYWYEYSLRRLQENPKIAGYIAADTLGRLVPGRA